MGEDLSNVVLQFFENGKLLKEINCTTVTLIPKVSNSSYVEEFRPIACCSTIYKILSKILTIRLKTVVDYLVGRSQSAFIEVIEGRCFLDNIILAHELIKGYDKKSVSPRCMIKFDIRKAYESVEWSSLRMLLLEFGLPFRMMNLIMECVSTVSYSLLIKSGLTAKFSAKKGLLPMSRYLFVLVMEYLNRSLKTLNLNTNFNFHPMFAKLEIVHICFVDDLLHCCRADTVFIKLLLNDFEHFSQVS